MKELNTAMASLLLYSFIFLGLSAASQTCDDAGKLYQLGKYKAASELAEKNLETNPNDFCSLKILINALHARESYSRIESAVLSAYALRKNQSPEVIDAIVACLKWKNKVGLDKSGLDSYDRSHFELVIPKILEDTNMTAQAALNLFYYLKTYGHDNRVRQTSDVYDHRSYDDIRYAELLSAAFLFCKKADLNDMASLDVFDFVCSMVQKEVIYMNFNDQLLNDEKQFPNDSTIRSYIATGRCYHTRYPDYTKKQIAEWDKSIKRDVFYFQLTENPSALSNEELDKMFEEFNRANEKGRVLRVLEQRYLRDKQNQKVALDFIKLLSEIPDDLYRPAGNLFSQTTAEIQKVFSQDSKVINEYATLLIRHKKYEQAHQLMVDKNDRESKKILFRAKLYVQSPEEAFSFAINEKLPFPFIREKLVVAHKVWSAERFIKLFFFISEKYPKEIDSLKILDIGFTYIRGLGTSYFGAFNYAKESDFLRILNVYRKNNYMAYGTLLEFYYWIAKNPTIEDLNSLLKRKMISNESVGEIYKFYGKKFFDKRSPSEMGHEGIKKGLEYFHLAEKYLKCDQDLLEHLFVSYDLISKGATADIYGNKLVNCGYSTVGLRAGGGKVRGRGPRGGRYYINGKGNKVYSSD